ncbi:transposase [Pseudomonas aeruginosa PAK]|nr:transposase [Pseudomonas aeruginosa PAK]VUY44506.1 transposase [Pseudomonas aeruginosa PAK]
MSKQRRTFSAEFKREAAALVLDQGYSHIDACRSLGGGGFGLAPVDETAPAGARWRDPEEQGAHPRTAEDPGAGGSDQPAGAAESDPKKATALLMSDELDRTR